VSDLRLIVFDVDGTLVDSQATIVAAFAAAFAAVGRPAPPRADILASIGRSLPDCLVQLMPGAGADTRQQAAQAYRAAFARSLTAGAEAAPLFPGIGDLLRALAAQPATLLGIATGKSRRGLAALLDAHRLGGVFQTVQTADAHPSKPDPAMLRACLVETGIDRSRAAFVGDTTFDMAMARALGASAIGVGWGYHAAADLHAAGAEAVARDAAALARLLDRVAGGMP
jgi:phosphoglycolate phosphatase